MAKLDSPLDVPKQTPIDPILVDQYINKTYQRVAAHKRGDHLGEAYLEGQLVLLRSIALELELPVDPFFDNCDQIYQIKTLPMVELMR